MTLSFAHSREIIEKAIRDYQPYAVVVMVSGGNDSLTAYHVARAISAPITHFMHGVTGTGIPETSDFVRQLAEQSGLVYLEANAGSKYERYVMRKGFIGRGEGAHNIAYHILKAEYFKAALSKGIRHGRRGRNILLINGARRQESSNRAKRTGLDPIRKDGPNIWVNIINEWSKQDCNDYLSGAGVKRNPVTELLCRSGECMCGTMQSQEARKEAAFFYPAWGAWLDDLEHRVNAAGFWWKWGQDVPTEFAMQQNGQMWLSDDWRPMCQSCEWRAEISEMK